MWSGGARETREVSVIITWLLPVRDILSNIPTFQDLNRYRRGHENCPQANLAKSGREYFPLFFSNASERRVWLSAESKILESNFGRFRLYRLMVIYFSSFFETLPVVSDQFISKSMVMFDSMVLITAGITGIFWTNFTCARSWSLQWLALLLKIILT